MNNLLANASNGCPYKGLQPYTEEDREYFFGRKRDTEVISSNLYIAPLTILYGTSGVGKSSVLQAGVMPHLRENRRLIVLLFNNWQGDNFNAALKESVLHEICSSTGKTAPDVLREISSVVGGNVTGVDSLPLDELISSCAEVFRRRILIIFDQFEEYFLYHTATTGNQGFDAEFARAVNHPESGVNFMLSMREEELSKLDRFRPRIPNLLSNLLRLENLDSEAAKDAILEPLPIYNERHPAHVVSIEPELVTKIIKQVRPDYVKQVAAGPVSAGTEAPHAQGAADRIETPFLQLVLIRLWEAEKQKQSQMLRVSTFEELGGALVIARTHLDKVMSQVTESQCATAAAVLRFLVTPTGSKIALDAESLASFANANKDDVLEVLDLLGSGKEMRILRKVTARDQPDRYELFHDVLGPAILDWRSRYVQAQRLIQEREQAEKEFSVERQRRLRQTIAVMALLLLLMFGATVYALNKRSEAREQANEAFRQRQQALTQSAEAQKQRSEAVEQKGIADEALERAQKAQNDLQIAMRESDRQKDIAIQARERESAARLLAEAETKRANDQADLAKNLVYISDYNLKGFDAARLGNTDEAIANFKEAFSLSNEQHNAATEASALVNLADAYGTKGAAIPLDLFNLFDKYDGIDYDEILDDNYQVRSYAANVDQLLKKEQGATLRADQEEAIKSYQAAIEATRRQEVPDLKRAAWMQQRIGDLQLTSQSILAVEQNRKPDLGPVIKAYNEASDSYHRVGLPIEEGILQTRIAYLLRRFSNPDDNKLEQSQRAISAYGRALEAFQIAGLSFKEAATMVRLGETYDESPLEDSERLKLAIRYYIKGAELYGQLGDLQKEGASYFATGGLYAKSAPPNKELSFQNYAKAITAFQEAQKGFTGVTKYVQSAEQQKEINKQRDELQRQVLAAIKQIGALYLNDPKPQANLTEYFESVIANYGSDNDGKVSALQAIGDLYSYTFKEKSEAINFYRAQSQVFKESGNSLKQAKTLVLIGNAYHNLNDKTNTKSSFEEARAIYRDLATGKIDNDTRDRFTADLIAIARTYIDLGEKRPAFETYDQALQLFESSSGESSAGGYRVDEVVQSAAKLVTETDAPRFFDRVTAYYQSRKDIYRQASSFELAGDLYAGWGKTADALDYYNRALNLRPTPSALVSRIGKLYYDSKNEAGAKKFFATLVEAHRNRKDAPAEASALAAIGAFYRDLNNTNEAINYYTQAARIFCRQKSTYGAASALRALSGMLKGLDEDDEAARLGALADNSAAITDCDIQIRRKQ